MKKPNAPILPPDATFDYGMAQRLVRQMQDSALHIFSGGVVSSLPDALRTGTPEDDAALLILDCTLVTDGRRGWLILFDEMDEWDVVREMTELFGGLLPGAEAGRDFVVRAACPAHRGKIGRRRRSRALEIPVRQGLRATVEEAYERAFEAGIEVAHDALIDAFRGHGFRLYDERTIRCEMAQCL